MSAVIDNNVLPVCHIVKGKVVSGTEMEYGSGAMRFATPALNLNELVWSRQEPGPAFDTSTDEIIDILIATGDWMRADPDGLMAQALEFALRTKSLSDYAMRKSYAYLPEVFTRRRLEFQLENELGGRRFVDGWATIEDLPSGRSVRMRAFPARLLHVIAGNSPGVGAVSIARGALTKAVNLFKLPSNDLFSAPAIMRGIAAVAPGHPLARSFSAVYWRGGDARVESMLMRPQFFDKIAAWGGDSTLKSIKNYVSPGLELVAFDPKTSVSMIGREAFASNEALEAAADAAAADATLLEQMACASSRYQFVEGSVEQVDRFAALLQQKMGQERMLAAARGRVVPSSLRDEIDGLRSMESYYKVWGDYRGDGMVIRSEEPVDFHPAHRVVNVVPVRDLKDAVRFVNVATQTVGVYPAERKSGLRDLLASAGAQRVVRLGTAGSMENGLGHDGFFPLQRLVRWVNDEG